MWLLELPTLDEVERDGGSYRVAKISAAEVRTLDAGYLADIQQLLTGLDQASRCARFNQKPNVARQRRQV